MSNFKKIIIAIITVYILLYTGRTYAQQVIINVPNADVLRKGQFYGRIPFRFRPFDDNKYYILNNDLIMGVGANTEITGAIININFAESHIEPELRTGFKTVIYLTGDSNTRLTFGSRMKTNIARSVTPFNIAYTHFSHRFKFDNIRISAGMYTASNHEFFPSVTGALLGLEGTIIQDKLTYAADWVSGNRPYGFIGVGMKYFPNKSTILIPGVIIPNGDNAKFGFIFAVTKYLN
jgi:hypothetical protein